MDYRQELNYENRCAGQRLGSYDSSIADQKTNVYSVIEDIYRFADHRGFPSLAKLPTNDEFRKPFCFDITHVSRGCLSMTQVITGIQIASKDPLLW